ncbi:MAG: hypothetical protein ACJAX4_002776 [Clostridium sp.]|jgi:hypothetical protein
MTIEDNYYWAQSGQGTFTLFHRNTRIATYKGSEQFSENILLILEGMLLLVITYRGDEI